MVFLQSRGQAGSRPGQPAHGLQGHDTMGYVGQAVRGGEALDFLVLDPFQQRRAGSAVFGVVGEVVNERVGVHEDRIPCLQISEGHGDSKIPNSGSPTMRSSVSTSPVHGIIPAVCLARLMVGRIVTMTFSCSRRGSGSLGLSTPFS